MKKIAMAFGLLGALSLMVIGCGGTDCDKAADEIEAKYGECGVDLPTSSDNASGGECTAEAGTQALCLSGCFGAASCDCVGLGDATACTTDDSAAYLDCIAGCSG